jgi:hypothetical protein
MVDWKKRKIANLSGAKQRCGCYTMCEMGRKAKNIADQLRQAILGSEMSRYRISHISGVDQAVLSNFVNCKRTITLVTAAKLAGVLGMELSVNNKNNKAGR